MVEDVLNDGRCRGDDARGNGEGAGEGFAKKFYVQGSGLTRRVDDCIKSRAIILVWWGLDDFAPVVAGKKVLGFLPTGVTTFVGAQSVMDIADSAIANLDKIRSDLGSVQIQLEATVNNISVTRTNVKFSESQIRDTDFASESSNFKRNNILAQAGSYALSQASTVQQGVLKLLQ